MTTYQVSGVKGGPGGCRLRLIGTVLSVLLTAVATTGIAQSRGDILIDDTRVFPENLSATDAGEVYIGSVKGVVYKAEPGAAEAEPWLRLPQEDGDTAIMGVLTDEARGTLWLCAIPNMWSKTPAKGPPAVLAADLDTGEITGRYPFPEPKSVCNDIAVAADGTLYATDTPNGRIYKLAPNAESLSLFGQDKQLAGIDGIAFDADGTLYVNTVTTGRLYRVGITAMGYMGAVTQIETSKPLKGPDGMRPIAGNRFVLAENQAGRVDVVTIDGDRADIRVLADDLGSPPGATVVGDTVYAVNGKIRYLIDSDLAGKDPGKFKAHAIPLSGQEETNE